MPAAKPATVAAYIAALPPERRKIVATVRAVVRKHLPKGYEEGVALGVICYQVPLKLLPDTYNGQALWYAALAARKNYYTLHLMSVYGSKEELARLRAGFKAAGKKLDIGKACIRFRKIEDLPLDVIG